MGDSSLLRLRGNHTLAVQLFGNFLETVTTSIHLENSTLGACLVLAHFQTHSGDERSAMLVDTHSILDPWFEYMSLPSGFVSS